MPLRRPARLLSTNVRCIHIEFPWKKKFTSLGKKQDISPSFRSKSNLKIDWRMKNWSGIACTRVGYTHTYAYFTKLHMHNLPYLIAKYYSRYHFFFLYLLKNSQKIETTYMCNFFYIYNEIKTKKTNWFLQEILVLLIIFFTKEEYVILDQMIKSF